MKGTSSEARTINKHLEQLLEKVNETERILYLKGAVLTFDAFKNEFSAKIEKIRTLIPIF